jgi:hypothetical protein
VYTRHAPLIVGGLDKTGGVLMASNRNLKSDDVDGFVLAVWDSFKDLEADYGVYITVTVHPRTLRGHLAWEAIARWDGPEQSEVVVAKAEAVWPTHYAKSLHALLYALLVRLWRELDLWKESEPPQDRPTPT